jgi:uncharacterized OB-fold protein
MITVASCPVCSLTFPPGGAICPRCGGPLTPSPREGNGRVLAATELYAPAAGWASLHRLLLVELEEGGTVLATAHQRLPRPGEVGVVREDVEHRWVWHPAGD